MSDITSTATADSTTPIMADQSVGDGSGSPLLVTSGASRTTYADNTNKMTNAATNLASASSPTTTTTDPSASKVTSISKSTDANGNVTSFNSDGTRTTVDKMGNPVTAQQVVNPIGPSATGAAVTHSTANTDGSMTTTYADGTSADFTQNADGTYTQKAPASANGAPATGDGANGGNGGSSTDTSGIDPTIKQMMTDNITRLTSEQQDAQANITALRATVANDPAMAAAADAISKKYDILIKNMQAKNDIIFGKNTKSGFQNGGFQYASEMNTGFLNDEQGKADARISDLLSQEQALILKSNDAIRNGDVKALNAATAEYDKLNNAKSKAVNDLLSATDKAIKTQQAQTKIDAAKEKQQTTDNIRISSSLGKTVADAIAKSGVTDPKKIDDYISAMATNSGITDPNILKSYVVKEQQNASKLDLSAQNTRSIIAKRNQTKTGTGGAKGGKDGAYTFTSNDISAYANLFNKGGKDPQGNAYAPRGKDGFVDPGAYIAGYNDWKQNGGTPKGYMKQFPVATNVNPDSYSMLPAALQPKAKATAQTIPQ